MRDAMLRPKLLLLDEPSFGLAPLVVQEIFRILRSINRNGGVSMLLVEQNANIARTRRLRLSDRNGVHCHGRPRRPSSPATTPCAVPISAIEGEEVQGFLHQLLSGVADGGIYASLALALVMIYQATHHVNFAQGAMAMFSTYIAWAMIAAGFPYWPAFGLTLVSSFAADVAIEQIIIRPVERGPVLNIVSKGKNS